MRWSRDELATGRWSFTGVVAVVALVSLSATFTTPALADRRTEAVAKVLLKRAKGDFAEGNFGIGAKRLQAALKACGEKKCTAPTRAALLMGLGAMQLKKGADDDASRTFAEAAKLQPDVAVDPGFDSPELRAAFAAATGTSENEEASGGVAPGGHDVDHPPPSSPVAPGPDKTGKPEGDGGDTGMRGDRGDTEAEEKSEPGPARSFRRLWIGAGAELELMRLPVVNDACALNATTGRPSNGGNLYCTTQAGSDFPARAISLESAGLCTAAHVAAGLCASDMGGHSSGGIARGDLRLLVSLDYAITANLLLGVHGGVTLFPYGGQAAVRDGRAFGSRFYGELRATWVFGANAIGSPGLRPMILLGGGVAPFDGHVSSTAAFCPAALPAPAGKPCQVGLFTGPVNVWQTSGPVFGTLGTGLRWGMTASFALTLAARVNLSLRGNGSVYPFGPFVPSFGPELAAQYGF